MNICAYFTRKIVLLQLFIAIILYLIISLLSKSRYYADIYCVIFE